MKPYNVFPALLLFGALASAQVKKIGCYKTTVGLSLKGKDDFNSVGKCGDEICNGQAAFGMNQKQCFCGDEIPSDADKADDALCNIKCPGFPTDQCGGSTKYFTLYDAGLVTVIPKAKVAGASDPEESTSAKPSTTTSAKPSLVTLPGQTVVVTASGDATPTSKPSSGGTSKAGIAAGVVIGILAAAAISGGLFMFIRNRKKRAVEEEHRRNAAVANMVANSKPPMSSDGSSFTDTRLDPVMAHRRMSDGSIADNQDYSRRILKVTNA